MTLKKLFVPALLVLIPLLFFYQTVFLFKVPFPGDLLLGKYEPYASSYPGTPNKGQGADVLRQIYPWKYFSIEMLKTGQIPLWDPYILSGNPHFATLQSGTFYPVNILFFVLPFVSAWSIYIILQFIFALSFTYLYLRAIKRSKIAALFGGVAFSFGAYFISWAEYGNVGHSLAFLPLALFSLEKIFSQNKAKWYLLFIFSLVCSFFAGYAQIPMYIYILCIFYVIAHFIVDKKRNYKMYVCIALSFISSVLISSIQALPTYELLQLSPRQKFSYDELFGRLLPIQNVLTMLVPDFFGNPATNNYYLSGSSAIERAMYVGIWPFFFAVYSFFSKKNLYVFFFGIVALFCFVSCLSFPPSAALNSIGIPLLSTGVPTRILSIFSFAMAVLGALGLDYFLIKKDRKVFLLVGFFVLVYFLLWVSTYIIPDQNMQIARHNLILPTIFFALGISFLIIKFSRRVLGILFIVLTVFELFYAFQKFNSFVPASFVYPATPIFSELTKIQGIDRSWGYGSANIEANLGLYERIYSPNGYDPLLSQTYEEFAEASFNGSEPTLLQRSDATIAGGYGVNSLKQNPFRLRALSIDGVKYVFNKKGSLGVDSAFSEKQFKLIWEESGWQIYKNLTVLPRIALFGNYTVYNDLSNQLKLLYNPQFDYKNVLILQNTVFPGFNVLPDPTAKVTGAVYSPNKITVRTHSVKDQLLFLSDNFLPGWKATVDGVVAPIFRADYTFKAIPVKAGDHHITLKYEPESFIVGFIISSLTLVVTLTVCIGASIKNRRK